MTRSMSCREFIDFLWRYLEGEVTQEEKAEFESHLARCPSCVAYMSSYKATVRLGRSAFDEPDSRVPEEVPEDLVAAILSARSRA